MPCDTITTTGIELGKNIDPKLLLQSLAELKLSPRQQGNVIYFDGGSYSLETKQATFRTPSMAGQSKSDIEPLAVQIRQNYGKQVTYAYAKQYGWQVKQTAENKYQLVKNSF